MLSADRVSGGATDIPEDSQTDIEARDSTSHTILSSVFPAKSPTAEAASSARSPSVFPDLGAKLEVLERLGEGGMGTVFKVRHRGLNQFRAVKILRKELISTHPSVWERFRREAMVGTELSHTNIVKVFDLDVTSDGTAYLLMEYLDGQDLETVLKENRRFTVDETVKLLIGVADALDRVHRGGIIHRDLKPANLFITKDGTAKILDFGISHMSLCDTCITAVGECVGTVRYMPPEQLCNETVDPRSDIYALAVVALEMLTGEPLLEDGNPRGMMARLLDDAPIVTGERLAALPSHTADALEKALSKSKEARFGTAWEFVTALAGPSLTSSIMNLRWEKTPADLIRFLGLDTKPTMLEKRRPKVSRTALLWIPITFLLLAAFVAFALYVKVSLPIGITAAPKVTIAVETIRIEGDEDTKWRGELVSALYEKYLGLEPRVQMSQSRRVEQQGQAPADIAADARGVEPDALTLHLTLLNRGRSFRLVSQLKNESGETVWQNEQKGDGVEELVEAATWSLSEEYLAEVPYPTAKGASDCKDDERMCRLSETAEQALVSGLFERVARLSPRMKAEPRWAFVPYAFEFIVCSYSLTPIQCRKEIDVPSIKVKLRSDRDAALRLTSGERSGIDPCRLAQSRDPLVRALTRFSGAYDSCRSEDAPICSRLDSFFERVACLKNSEALDDPLVTQTYFEEFVQKEMGHYMIVGAHSSLFWTETEEKAVLWSDRMIARHGVGNAGVAETMVDFSMVKRNGTEALIWSRRSRRAGWREGLALHLDGWLKNGIEKSVRELSKWMIEGETLSPTLLHRGLRGALQPVLLLKDRDLADVWLAAVAELPTQQLNPVFREAIALIEALRNRDKRICRDAMDETHPLLFEYLFWCGESERIVREDRRMSRKGYAERSGRFFVAESMLELGKNRDAAKVFSVLEKDPLIRSAYPVTSILAIERLGRICEDRGDMKCAYRNYKKFLDIWPGLDIPLSEHLRSKRRLAKRRIVTRIGTKAHQ